MSAKPPETFAVDRLKTPIGIALLVSDADGALRALDWEDYEPRMLELLRLHYGAPVLKAARAPDDIRAALSGYFKGDLDRLATIRWRVAGTPFQRKVWKALPKIPPGSTMSYGALAAKIGTPKAVRAVGRTRQRRQPDQRRRALPSPDRRQRFAGQVWRRTGAQALAAGARRRGAEGGSEAHGLIAASLRVIARSKATKQSIHRLARCKMDCFASLAMTTRMSRP